MSRELIAVIDQIGREKGIDKAKVIGAVEAALQTAAKKPSQRSRSRKRAAWIAKRRWATRSAP